MIIITVSSENFARILFSRVVLKGIFATLKKSRLGHDLPTPVNARMILPFRKGVIFAKLRMHAKFRENKTLNLQ